MKAQHVSRRFTKWLVAAIVLVAVTIVFSKITGRPWYEALFISVWIAWLSARRPAPSQNGFRGMATDAKQNTSAAFPTFSKIGHFMRPIFPAIRKIFIGLFVAVMIAGSAWLIVTLLRWFWVHPLFR